MLDVLIIGGGVHGAVLASRLVNENIVDIDRLAILDPHERPLELFRSRAAATGMAYLRSPGSHSLSADKTALLKWGRERKPVSGDVPVFFGAQRRPSTTLFFEHCDFFLAQSGIDSRYMKGRAASVRYAGGSLNRRFLRVETENGALDTRILIMAPGAREALHIPDWADGLERCSHVFSPGFSRSRISDGRRIAIIGGGMSAHQLALGFSETHSRGKITLIRRHPSPIRAYDSDPGFLGLKKSPVFNALLNPTDRRKLIDSARWPGSVPRDLADSLDSNLNSALLELLCAEIVSADAAQTESVTLRLSTGETRHFDELILATGFINDLPRRPWISSLAASEKLKTHCDGYPIPSASLEWAPGLFLSGGLAELEAGPSGLNIIGAHKAHEKMRFAISEKL